METRTLFYVTADYRNDQTSIAELSGSLAGRYLYYDNTLNELTDVSSTVNREEDRIVSIAVWNNPKQETEQDNPSWEADSNVSITGDPNIDEQVWGDHYHVIRNIKVKRNRSFYQLFNCTTEFTLVEPLGYNTSVRLSSIKDEPLYVADPLLYLLNIDGIATFYFSPTQKSGWFRCILNDDITKTQTTNLTYDPTKSTALGPCDLDGWRTVINAQYNGFEFNFYPQGYTNWWNNVLGLGNNIKIRLLDNNNQPLPNGAWYPIHTIRSGLNQVSEIGSTTSVYKVEARYITDPLGQPTT